MGVWQDSAQRSSLSLRGRRDDLKLAISDASSMKGLSAMLKFFSFPQRERVSRKTTDPDDFDGKHGLVNGKDGLKALSSVFAALRQLHLRALRACRLNRVFPLTRSFQCGTIFSAHII